MNATATPLRSTASFDVARLRAQFPILSEKARGQRLAYLDNAATTQKPESVLRALQDYYRHSNSNVHRAVHDLAERATTAYESSRERIAEYLNADRNEVVFTRGTTESINLVAHAYLEPRLKAGDEILITEMEHHSNIVPWQLVAARTGARVVAAPVLDDGSLDLQGWRARLGPRTRLVSVVQISNALGTENPVELLVREAHAAGATVVVDAAQSFAHGRPDMRALGADFYCASGHKAYGPTGIGVLFGRAECLADMQPWMGGGDMIHEVRISGSTWAEPPYRFEAGTPNIAGAIGFGAAVDFIRSLDLEAVRRHERGLSDSARELLSGIKGVRLIGTAERRGPIVSFVLQGAHAQDIGAILDQKGVAVRTGHHCTMPLMARFGVGATVRASFSVYNDAADVEQLADGMRTAHRLLLG